MTLEEVKNIYPPETNVGRCEDLSNQKFGRLKPLYLIDRTLWRLQGKRKRTTWLCICDCGNFTTVVVKDLKSGSTRSCGCLREEYRKNKAGKSNLKEILPGAKFGYLTVLERTKTSNHGYYYLCECECGSKTEILGYSLTSGNTISCGCIKSKGEEKIAKILSQNNIIFEREKTFESCKDKNKLRFDFFIPVLNRLIEYDGIQHFKKTNTCFDRIPLEERRRKDNIKTSYAFKNGYSLIRIPYTELDNIDLEMILGDKFLVKELEKENEI